MPSLWQRPAEAGRYYLPMPSPVGHVIAGLTTAWVADRLSARLKPGTPDAGRWLLLACVVAAAAPDLDLLVSHHRTYSHSLGAAILVGLGTWMALRIKATVKRQKANPVASPAALSMAAAYFTHIVLDWLGKDTSVPPGMMALWPISSKFYLSGLDLFPEISRRYWRPSEFIVGNLRSLAWEVSILGPIALLVWWVRKTRRTI